MNRTFPATVSESPVQSRVATVLLTHQPPAAVRRMLAYWREQSTAGSLIVAYGGSRADFDEIEGAAKVYVDDPGLRTRDHPRERQSYLGVLQASLPEVRASGASHVHLAEFDEIPLVNDLNRRLLELAATEGADVLGHQLLRVDRTGHSHLLGHLIEPEFGEFWRSISARADSQVVLSMLGCGSFWTVEAYEQVASLAPPLRIYLELFLPTAAHHLGFRVRPIPGQREFMHPAQEKTTADFERFQRLGAWCIHPVKRFWLEESEAMAAPKNSAR